MPRVTDNSRLAVTTFAVLSLCALGASGCARPDTPVEGDVTLFTGARLIVGDASPPIENAVFIVQDDKFTYVGRADNVEIPEGTEPIDLTGKTVMPAIVNAHLHLATEREERVDQLQRMAYYGAGVVVSLGRDTDEVVAETRDEIVPDGARVLTTGRGISRPEPGRSDVAFWIDTEEEARAAVRDLAALDVDLVKIWVDDRSGRYEKPGPLLYGAVIDEAHAHDLRVTAHVYTLEDAKGLLRAGVDIFAHGVRDLDVDDEFMELWADRPEVVLVPNLPDPGVAQDLSWLSGTIPADQLAEMQAASTDRPAAKEAFGIQARNLARFKEAGVRIAFGTDGSAPWAVHLEMEDMVRTGMTPHEVIIAATANSASLMGLSDVGVIRVGRSADFIVLDANPLDDITNTRQIDAVYLRGEAIDREGLSARATGG
jgi:imidazolonepropionase-like amidohydrolase